MNPADRIVAAIDAGLRSVAGRRPPGRPSPAESAPGVPLSPAERRVSARLMRVNRSGEISAQALYIGQQLGARAEQTAAQLRDAAAEEYDHLAWCTERLTALGGRPSLFDPVFFAGSFAIGVLAGLGGDDRSLGFVAETERQVESHLADHLSRLPESDAKSRAILRQMSDDESRHGADARSAGGTPIREPVRTLMTLAGEFLRRTAYRL